MQSFSLIPLLYIIQIGFFLTALHKKSTFKASGYWFVLVLTIWGSVSAGLALSGSYRSSQFLMFLPGLWLPTVPFLLVGAILLTGPTCRACIEELAHTTPAHWLIALQCLRISAVGTLFKTFRGEFPLQVEIAVGLTDLVYGLSALFLYRHVKSGHLSSDALLIWHLTGCLIILIPGELAIMTHLPGPLLLADGGAVGSMLEFPMVLAPSLVVPIFLLFNLLGAYSAKMNLSLKSKLYRTKS